jgi:hypothetical protein
MIVRKDKRVIPDELLDTAWQPHITAPSSRTLASLRVPIKGLLARWPARALAAGIGDEPFHETFIRETGALVRDTHLLSNPLVPGRVPK